MTMDIEQIERYLDDAETEFDRILAAGERKRKAVLRTALLGGALAAASVALLLWLVPARQAPENPLTPIQIAEGIQRLMLLDIGDIDSVVAVPRGSHAILTARMKDGSTCSFLLKCNDVEGTTTLFAYTENQ